MPLVQAVVVIGQDFDDAALIDAAMGRAMDHPLHFIA